MKKLLSILAVLAVAFTVSAQQYNGSNHLYQVGFILPSTATNIPTTAGYIPCTDYRFVSVAVSLTLSNPAACWNAAGRDLDALKVVMAPSLAANGLGYNTNFVHTWICPVNTNWVYPRMTFTTNFDMGAYGYLKVLYITNSMTISDFTNVVISYGTKPRMREFR